MRRLELETHIVVRGMQLALVLLPFRLVYRAVSVRPLRTRGREVSADRIVATVQRVPRATCLPQVLAAAWLFAGYGHPATIRLGVAKEEGCVAAHAWLESDGRAVLGEPEPGTFVGLK